MTCPSRLVARDTAKGGRTAGDFGGSAHHLSARNNRRIGLLIATTMYNSNANNNLNYFHASMEVETEQKFAHHRECRYIIVCGTRNSRWVLVPGTNTGVMNDWPIMILAFAPQLQHRLHHYYLEKPKLQHQTTHI